MEQVDTIKAERDAIEQDLKVQQDDMGELRDTRVIRGRYHNWRNSGLSVKSNPESYCFSFAAACDWSKKLHPLGQSENQDQSRLGHPRFPAL